MSWMERLAGKQDRMEEGADVAAELRGSAPEDAAVEEALKNFRMSIHAWSDAAYVRPRSAAQVVRHRSWRLAAGWALAALLIAGGFSGGMFERHQRIERERIAAARLAEQQKAILEEQAKEEEDLLAKVDRDVSREVPSAMEPLAQLMNEDAK
jgi:bisphosphoglycerate-independent phosphoglycerate mutase (AlkP superfamily)